MTCDVLAVLDVDALLVDLRREYLHLEHEGVTHGQMAEATGLPRSTFSMWLRGYRKVTKVQVLDALVKGLRQMDPDPLG